MVCDLQILRIRFVCFSVSKFVACDRNYDWRQQKTHLWTQLLNVIWSMPKNFAFFPKTLDKFFINSTIPRSIVKKYSLFSMFLKLAGNISWQLISELSNLEKNLSSHFWKNAKFLGMDHITSKNCIKSSWMQVNKILLTRDRPEQFPSFFVCSFQWNQSTMRWSRVPKAYHFLNILANWAASMLFHCFYDS